VTGVCAGGHGVSDRGGRENSGSSLHANNDATGVLVWLVEKSGLSENVSVNESESWFRIGGGDSDKTSAGPSVQ